MKLYTVKLREGSTYENVDKIDDSETGIVKIHQHNTSNIVTLTPAMISSQDEQKEFIPPFY
jgi:hypothetical protein